MSVIMNFLEAITIFNANRGLKVRDRHVNGQDRDLRQFAIFMHNCPVESVSDESVITWLTLFKEMGYAVGTLVKKEEALIQFFKFWRRKGLDVLDHMLIPLTPREYVKPRVCSRENYEEIVRLMSDNRWKKFGSIRNKALFTLLWNTGMRVGEAAQLNISDIDINKRVVTIKTEKSRGIRPFRTIPYDTFDDYAVEAIPLWLEKREQLLKTIPLKDNSLFFGVKTTNTIAKKLEVSAIGEIFAKYSKRIGLSVEDYINPHSLRHHFGHELARRGLNNSVISEAMGHSSLTSSYRYTQLEAGDICNLLRGK